MGYWRADSNRDAGAVFFCSECGVRVHMVVSRQKYSRPVVYVYPYCPWCQSEMNGGIVRPKWTLEEMCGEQTKDEQEII